MVSQRRHGGGDLPAGPVVVDQPVRADHLACDGRGQARGLDDLGAGIAEDLRTESCASAAPLGAAGPATLIKAIGLA
jgi:hypothetical protein